MILRSSLTNSLQQTFTTAICSYYKKEPIREESIQAYGENRSILGVYLLYFQAWHGMACERN
jgi:hypothetical protein